MAKTLIQVPFSFRTLSDLENVLIFTRDQTALNPKDLYVSSSGTFTKERGIEVSNDKKFISYNGIAILKTPYKWDFNGISLDGNTENDLLAFVWKDIYQNILAVVGVLKQSSILLTESLHVELVHLLISMLKVTINDPDSYLKDELIHNVTIPAIQLYLTAMDLITKTISTDEWDDLMILLVNELGKRMSDNDKGGNDDN